MTKVGAVRDLDVDGATGPLRARHYTPMSTPKGSTYNSSDRGATLSDRRATLSGSPLTVFLHGGGFVIGDLDTHDEPCRMLTIAREWRALLG